MSDSCRKPSSMDGFPCPTSWKWYGDGKSGWVPRGVRPIDGGTLGWSNGDTREVVFL